MVSKFHNSNIGLYSTNNKIYFIYLKDSWHINIFHRLNIHTSNISKVLKIQTQLKKLRKKLLIAKVKYIGNKLEETNDIYTNIENDNLYFIHSSDGILNYEVNLKEISCVCKNHNNTNYNLHL